MGLARIFSDQPEHAQGLAQQLQRHGYTVQVLHPGEASASPADLEIHMEICDSASALRRASEVASELHADIALAPGAVQWEPPRTESAVHETPIPVFHQAAPEPVAPAEEEAAAVPVAAAIETEASPAYSRLAPSARAVAASLAACIAAAVKLFVSARDQFRESWETARIRNAEAHALREQRLTELMRQQADARQRAIDSTAERKAMSAYLQQMKREVPHAFVEVRRQWFSTESAAFPEPPARVSWPMKLRGIQLGKWQAVVAGGLAASALFVAGLAIVALHSRPSMPRQPAAAAQTGGVTLQPSPTQSSSPARPSPVLRQAMTRRVVVQARPRPRVVHGQSEEFVADDVVVRRFPAPKPTPRTQAQGWKHFSDLQN